MGISLLVASSDEHFRESIRESLQNIANARIVSTYPEVSSNLYIRVLQDLERNPDAALIVDLASDPEGALKALEKVKQAAPDVYAIASNYHADGETVIASLRAGCNDFMVQPVKRGEFREVMARLERTPRRAASGEMGLFKLDNPWPRIGWSLTAGLLVVGVVLGFFVLGREQQNGPTLGTWAAICRALGVTADIGPAGEPQPPLRTPSRIAWTTATLSQIAAGNAEHGAFVALNCTACHGEQGVSQAGLYPTLAGMDGIAIYKQLDDFRAGKRSWGAMNAIAQALSAQDWADAGAYFASRTNGLPPFVGERFQAGHTLREDNPAIRLVFAGDPARGTPPCAACHGPGDHKLGAPQLKTQQPAYIERQLAAFAQGFRQNDINEQMRTIAAQLTPEEMHLVAEFYGTGAAVAQVAGR